MVVLMDRSGLTQSAHLRRKEPMHKTRARGVGRTVWLDACAMGKKHSQSFPRESNCGGMDEKGKRNRL
jgi:hypothetical protein